MCANLSSGLLLTRTLSRGIVSRTTIISTSLASVRCLTSRRTSEPFGPRILLTASSRLSPDDALAVHFENQVAWLDSGGLGGAALDWRDDEEFAIGPHLDPGSDSLERSVEVLILDLERLRRHISRVWITQIPR